MMRRRKSRNNEKKILSVQYMTSVLAEVNGADRINLALIGERHHERRLLGMITKIPKRLQLYYVLAVVKEFNNYVWGNTRETSLHSWESLSTIRRVMTLHLSTTWYLFSAAIPNYPE